MILWHRNEILQLYYQNILIIFLRILSLFIFKILSHFFSGYFIFFREMLSRFLVIIQPSFQYIATFFSHIFMNYFWKYCHILFLKILWLSTQNIATFPRNITTIGFKYFHHFSHNITFSGGKSCHVFFHNNTTFFFFFQNIITFFLVILQLSTQNIMTVIQILSYLFSKYYAFLSKILWLFSSYIMTFFWKYFHYFFFFCNIMTFLSKYWDILLT